MSAHNEHADHGAEPHVTPLQTYFAVFGSLLFFTVLTYAVSFADLGIFALPIAMAVACVKAFLVSAFFMHLWHDEKFNILVFASSIFFIGVFFTFTMVDFTSRDVISDTEGYYTWHEENPEICDDGMDNDVDNLSDCADGDCRMFPACLDANAGGHGDEEHADDEHADEEHADEEHVDE